ncbi:hypothetical protein [Listeria valentina]|uniref:hypothetical protein n=1 Tax=Listeria valentina TaxID=2705293 RepID=UPI0014306178
MTITPSNATDQSLTFTSANPKIMKVDKDGITATVQVTVTKKGIKVSSTFHE